MENTMTKHPFQTMREVDDYLSGDAIVCLICGKSFQRLNSHLQRMHQVEPDDYRRRFGIPFCRALASEASRAKSGAAMTPERIEQFMRASRLSPIRDPTFPRGVWAKGRAPAVTNQWKNTIEASRYFSRKLVIVSCPKCGGDVATTALGATQPVHCMKCTSPDSRRQRACYWRRKSAA